ncbi:MAG: YXWGXW repeat-containing protein [Verrucomicrobiota bacterium]
MVIALLSGSGCVPERTGTIQQSRTPAVTVSPPRIESEILGAPEDLGPDVAALPVANHPPPPQIEVVGEAPNAGYVWIPGRWEWNKDWTWVSGHWTAKPDSAAGWSPGRWARRDDGWIWIRGYWRTASAQNRSAH